MLVDIVKIREIFSKIENVNRVIETISLINDEHLYLTGGTLRNSYWAFMHEKNLKGEEDCDIIFYNPMTITKDYELFMENKLKKIIPEVKWSVKNQARMHIRNNHFEYKSILDALMNFPETCSAIAIGSNWDILAPYGTEDLLNLIVRPTPFCIKNEIEIFDRRVIEKKWLSKWPKLRIRRFLSRFEN